MGHTSQHPALPRVTTSVVTKTIPIYKAVPTRAEMERPPPVRGEGCCTITGSLAQRRFPNDVILHAVVGPAWPAEVLR